MEKRFLPTETKKSALDRLLEKNGGDQKYRGAKEFKEVGGSPIPGITLRQILRGHTDRINRISWSSDGRYLASPSSDKIIRIWDCKSWECVAILKGHNDQVVCSTWSPDGTMLASGS